MLSQWFDSCEFCNLGWGGGDLVGKKNALRGVLFKLVIRKVEDKCDHHHQSKRYWSNNGGNPVQNKVCFHFLYLLECLSWFWISSFKWLNPEDKLVIWVCGPTVLGPKLSQTHFNQLCKIIVAGPPNQSLCLHFAKKNGLNV